MSAAKMGGMDRHDAPPRQADRGEPDRGERGGAGRRSDLLYRRALRHLPGGNSRSTVFLPPHPPYVSRAAGCELVDVDGHTVIDLQNNYTALIHGHAFPPVSVAAAEALASGSAYGLPTEAEIELAECLAERVGWADSWRFANSGTEAVMMAVRAARATTGRDLLIRFAGCYHGSWDAVTHEGARGVPAASQRDVLTLPLGDGQALLDALDRHGEDVAAVLLDAMPNRAGLNALQPEIVELIRSQTRERGILLILDEVITFRLAPGGLHSLYGIEGDLIVLGKMIGGGFPVGAIGGHADAMEGFDPRRRDAVAHGGTFSANPVTMRAGVAALTNLPPAEIERIDSLGELLREQLRERGWTVNGRGSLLQVQVPAVAELWWRLYDAGVLIAGNGLMCTSTPMDESVIARALDVFDRAGRAFNRAGRAFDRGGRALGGAGGGLGPAGHTPDRADRGLDRAGGAFDRGGRALGGAGGGLGPAGHTPDRADRSPDRADQVPEDAGGGLRRAEATER